MYVGKLELTQKVYIASDSPNKSVLLTGISGSGKTTRLNQIELELVNRGETVLVVDVNQTHSWHHIYQEIREQFFSLTNYIHVAKDGMGNGLLNPLNEREDLVNLINSAVYALSANLNMGSRQIGVLRQAVIAAAECRYAFNSEAEAIASALLSRDDAIGEVVYDKLWTVLNCGALRPSGKAIQRGRINILDLSGLDLLTQSVLSEVLLTMIWRRVQTEDTPRGNITFVFDECQNLSWKKDAMIRRFLCEGRKFGLQLLLATQTTEVFAKDVVALLEQAATRLCFRPFQSETQKLAKKLAQCGSANWQKILEKLVVGQSIAVGDFDINGQIIRQPLMLT